jgi:hypothetical protein
LDKTPREDGEEKDPKDDFIQEVNNNQPVEVVQQETTIMKPRIKKMEFNGDNKGNLLNMKVDCSDHYLITSFENGSISIFDFTIGEIIKELPPMDRCLINGTLNSA